MKKRTTAFLLALLILATATLPAFATNISHSGLPYDTYNYDYREYIRFTPAAYVPDTIIRTENYTYNGESLGRLVSPQDLSRSPTGNLYIADTGNNRIIVLDSELQNCLDVITTFDNNGVSDSFNEPYGVTVSERGWIYVADRSNNRIVVLDQDDNLIQIFANPRSESLADDYVFQPLKVAVDYADRVYCTAQFVCEGIMVFESNGTFSNYFGTINVSLTLWEQFWKRIATREERANQDLYIPTEFTGIDIDPSGFVYASNIDPLGVQGVRRLNPKGEDVIKKGQNENVGGDIQYDGQSVYSGVSQFIDVAYRGNGIYSLLDRRRGRVFTYDHEGNILYIFGGLGTQEGTFNTPVALEDMNGRLMVLDAGRAEIVAFKATEYGRVINEAVSLRFDGDEAMAVPLWERVLQLDENNELANTGLGKAYLTAGDNAQAMKYLRLGMSREYYSIAFRRYRNAILIENANAGLTIAAIAIAGALIYRSIRKRKKKVEEEGGFSFE
jgi:hypothetical protein